jgi:hypothetical protein
VGDRVFQRVMALTKGRAFVAKALKLLLPPPTSQYGAGGPTGSATAMPPRGLHVIWALLRNALALYGPLGGASGAGGAAGPTEGDNRMVEATEKLTGSCTELLKKLQDPGAACSALEAFNAGAAAAGMGGAGGAGGAAGALLPLFPAGRVAAGAAPAWLGGLLSALLLRASELGLGSLAAMADEGDACEPATSARWEAALQLLTQLLLAHLIALLDVKKGRAPGLPGLAPASYVQGLACVPLARSLMAHVGAEQRDQLRACVSELAH